MYRLDIDIQYPSRKLKKELAAEAEAKRKEIKIPKMSEEDIKKWYSHIRPIVHNNGTPVYLPKLNDNELFYYEIWPSFSDSKDFVNYNELSFLVDVKMFHSFGSHGIHHPTVSEIIKQIPEEFLERVVAFEFIPNNLALNILFTPVQKRGYCVSIVRLYQKKDETNEVAKPINEYPTEDTKTPIGITDQDFEDVKSFTESVINGF